MKIYVNNQEYHFEKILSIKELLEFLNLSNKNIVVELNLEIVKKDQFVNVFLKDLDKLELLEFVGGG